jgi:ATP-dependent RNA helicase HelY
MLLELGYFEVIGDDIESTTDGKRLAQIYGERDLLVSECLRQNCWERVDAPTLAALIAALVFEPRFEDESLHPKLPKGEFGQAFEKTMVIWDNLQEISRAYRLSLTGEPDASMAIEMQRWANGARLDSVLKATGMLAGDFIRWCKQTIDLLEQLAKLKEPRISATAEQAIDKIKRGIVAYSYYA